MNLKIKSLLEKRKKIDVHKRGVFLKVDLEYPKEIQELHEYLSNVKLISSIPYR